MSALRRRRAGFTLIELMVSLTVGGIAISSMYAIGSASTRVFHQQQQVATAQSALRMALNYLKRDITRAGYLSTPRATVAAGGQICGGTLAGALDTPPLAAFTNFQNNLQVSTANLNLNVGPTTELDPINRASGFTVDDIVMMGNYETSAEYPNVTFVANNVIALGTASHAFRRDFTNWYNPVPQLRTDQEAFRRAFLRGRLIRLRLTNNTYHFSTIAADVDIPAAGSPNAIQITLTQPLPAGCDTPLNGGWIAPVSAIRYTVRDPRTADTVDLQRAGVTAGPMAQLVREEVLPGNKTAPLGDNRRAVLDYVVGFNLAFTIAPVAALGTRDNYVAGTFPGDGTTTFSANTTDVASTVNTSLERIRSVSIDLAVRTPEQDPTLQFTPQNCANLRCYQVFDDRPGAARVRRVRAEVFVPNVANEGY